MDESLKKIYKLWAKDRNRVSDGELSLFIFNFNNYLLEYLQTGNKKKIFSSLKQSFISYLGFISDLSSKYPEIYNKLSKEIIAIHTTLINPYNDQQLRRKTFKSALTIILNNLFFGKVKDWATFFHFYFYGLENQKLNIGTPEKATVNDILHSSFGL